MLLASGKFVAVLAALGIAAVCAQAPAPAWSAAYRPPWADNVVKLQLFNQSAGAFFAMCMTPDNTTVYTTGNQLRPTLVAIDTARFTVRAMLPFTLPSQWDPTVQALHCGVPGLIHALTNDAIVIYDIAGQSIVLQHLLAREPANFHTGWAWDAANQFAYVTTRSAQVLKVDMLSGGGTANNPAGTLLIAGVANATAFFSGVSFLGAPVIDESLRWTSAKYLYMTGDPNSFSGSGTSELLRMNVDTMTFDGVVRAHNGSSTGFSGSFRILFDSVRGFVVMPFRTIRAGSLERFQLQSTLAPGVVVRGSLLNRVEELDWGVADNARGYYYVWSTTLRGSGGFDPNNRLRWLLKVRASDFVVVGGIDLANATSGRVPDTPLPPTSGVSSDFSGHSPRAGILDSSVNALYLALFRNPAGTTAFELQQESFVLRVDLNGFCPSDCNMDAGRGNCTDPFGRCVCAVGWTGPDCGTPTGQPAPPPAFPAGALWPLATSRMQVFRSDVSRHHAMAVTPDGEIAFAYGVADQPYILAIRMDFLNVQTLLNVSLPASFSGSSVTDMAVVPRGRAITLFLLGTTWVAEYNVTAQRIVNSADVRPGIGIVLNGWAVDGAANTAYIGTSGPFLVVLNLATLAWTTLFPGGAARPLVTGFTRPALWYPTTSAGAANTSAPALAVFAADTDSVGAVELVRWNTTDFTSAYVVTRGGATGSAAAAVTVNSAVGVVTVVYSSTSAGAAVSAVDAQSVNASSLNLGPVIQLDGVCGNVRVAADADSPAVAVWGSSASTPALGTLDACRSFVVLNTSSAASRVTSRVDLSVITSSDPWVPTAALPGHMPRDGFFDPTPGAPAVYISTATSTAQSAFDYSSYFVRVDLNLLCLNTSCANGYCLAAASSVQCVCDAGFSGALCDVASATRPTITSTTDASVPSTTVVLTSSQSNSIWFTLDGTIPTPNVSSLYVSPIVLNATTSGFASFVVTAVAVRSGVATSSPARAVVPVYGQLPPVFTPSAGTYPSPLTVFLQNPGAGGMQYSMNAGSSWLSYDASTGIVISSPGNTTILSRVAAGAAAASAIASASYIVYSPLSAPSLSPASWSASSMATLTLTPGSGATQTYFTLLGGIPRADGTSFTYVNPFRLQLPGSITLRAISWAQPTAGNSWLGPSAAAAWTLTFPQAAAPVVTSTPPNEGTATFYGFASFNITCTTPGSTIYYTQSNPATNPTNMSAVFVSQVNLAFITGGAVLQTYNVRALCLAPGFLPSETTRGPQIVIRRMMAVPTVNVPSGSYVTAIVPTISRPETDCIARYTLDGSEPAQTSPNTTTLPPSFTTPGFYTLRFRCFSNPFSFFIAPSPVVSVTYNISAQQCAVSAFSPWSNCSQACGGGVQSRTRSVIVEPTLGNVCPPLEESQPCNTQLCSCVVSPWTPWSSCSATCNGGTRTRSRSVLQQPTPPNSCPPLTQSASCNTQACDIATASVAANVSGLSAAAISSNTTLQAAWVASVAGILGIDVSLVQFIDARDVSVSSIQAQRRAQAALPAATITMQLIASQPNAAGVSQLQSSIASLAAQAAQVATSFSAASGTPVTVVISNTPNVSPPPSPPSTSDDASRTLAITLGVLLPVLIIVAVGLGAWVYIAQRRVAQYRSIMEAAGHVEVPDAPSDDAAHKPGVEKAKPQAAVVPVQPPVDGDVELATKPRSDAADDSRDPAPANV